ncbi:MAG: ComF family protein [Epsilonproteobacteria bacterium]|nr:ComF family protein [Campylobacterota bacterium]
MKCLLCENYSLAQHICKKCQQLFLTPSLYKRTLPNGVQVFSFYRYEDIKQFLSTKHTDLGYAIYSLMADLSFKKFANEFHTERQFISIGIDENTKSAYSHAAILNHALKSRNIKPLHNKLLAQNEVSYSGKSKAFRLANPRDFRIKKFKQSDVILVDDIITTGTTLTQAITVMQKENKEIAFCLTLCDVKMT